VEIYSPIIKFWVLTEREADKASGREGDRQTDRGEEVHRRTFVTFLMDASNFQFTTTKFSISILFQVNKIQLCLNDLLNTWIKPKIQIH
jgi:hypothetical protein